MSTPTAIVTDLVGTFLRPAGGYDRERFGRVRSTMDAAGCRFVAVGDQQCPWLAAQFDRPEELAFIAESGAVVVDRRRFVDVRALKPEAVAAALAALERTPEVVGALSSPHALYVQERNEHTLAALADDYPRNRSVADLRAVPEPVVKVVGVCPPERTAAVMAALMPAVVGRAKVSSSTPGRVEVVASGVTRSAALATLLTSWGLDASGVVAFGDGLADLDLLRACGRSFAMANGAPACEAEATDVAPANGEDGVLVAIEALFTP
ncbi:HAD hydrolase family protein [Nigerium massiliense]|uniref:HAD hydrolase family protein n=1 Tax=Nigerium massiliense TaxID=1522317 RepID=UPI000590297A|nr:HAD hydrolase family protein [Nigerium massiliense]